MALMTEKQRAKTWHPKKLSEALRQAVADAKALEVTPGYRLNMFTWHSPRTGSKPCEVCMAGAVMARRRMVGIRVGADPMDYTDPLTTSSLFAVDSMRRGMFALAYEQLHGKSPEDDDLEVLDNARKVVVDSYGKTSIRGRVPWRVYERAAKILAAAGL